MTARAPSAETHLAQVLAAAQARGLNVRTVYSDVVKWPDGRVQVTARLTVGAQDDDDFGNVDWSE